MSAVSHVPATGLSLPTVWLDVPDELKRTLASAVADGNAKAAAFAASHTAAELAVFPGFVQTSVGWPPSSEEQKAELAQLHKIAASRETPKVATAQWLAKHGTRELWDIYLEQYSKLVGPQQAAAAAKLLHDTLDMAEQAGTLAKSSSLRPRPFITDPSLPVAIDKPGNNPSFPSGHCYLAFAAAAVLSRLMPARKAEFEQLAMQMAYSRMYGGVHYQSDVVAGAKLGALVGAYMLQAEASTLQAAAA